LAGGNAAAIIPTVRTVSVQFLMNCSLQFRALTLANPNPNPNPNLAYLGLIRPN
jgi:hypothetical protein